MSEGEKFEGERKLTLENIIKAKAERGLVLAAIADLQENEFSASRALQEAMSKVVERAISDAFDDWSVVQALEEKYLEYLGELMKAREPSKRFMLWCDGDGDPTINFFVDDENGEQLFGDSATLFEVVDGRYKDSAEDQEHAIAELEAVVERLKASFAERFGREYSPRPAV